MMFKLTYVSGATASILALSGLTLFSEGAQAANAISVTCASQEKVPAVIAILSNQETSQVTRILSFLPQYFSEQEALALCATTAKKLHTFYNENRMNYLASDTIGEKPVVCAVERRGLGCDSYNSDILFSLQESVSPTKLLYNMLGENFKGSQLPSSRTVSRIYSDLRPFWWPFNP